VHSPEKPPNSAEIDRILKLELEIARLKAQVAAGATQREEAESALADSEERYRTLFNSIDEGFCIIEFFDGPHGPDSDYVHVEANPAYTTHAGIPNVVGQKLREMVPDEADGWAELYGGVLRTGKPIRFERELVATGRYLELAAFRVEPASRRQVAVLFQDITARKRAEEALQHLNETLEARVTEAIAERKHAEDALRQSQKMEAVGQLTGGIAHDFNNLLTGIMGALELMQAKLRQGRLSEIDRYVAAAQGAAKRAASLTHRLLAFSRRQTLDPKPTDVNRLVIGMEELIRRTVGPQIALEVVTAPGLWTALIDASQLESALLNLCINARDAMPEGGRITIETANKWLDEHAARERDLPPGQYLSLCVTDSGVGMTPDVIARAFDPFFTTKPIGQGTGLGLSMVYGFARQSGGQVRIYSEVGQGTTMCLYFPRHYGGADEGTTDIDAARAARAKAGKTVLIVDDEPTVRMLVIDVLEDLGFTVVEAGDGAAGLRILQSDTPVDLLVSDVGLPGGMNGRQLADAARTIRPDLKVLFITGYAENAIIGSGQLGPGMRVLTKPFVVETFAARVLEMIEENK
jgi:PAS domain S-box-containing protein